MSLQVAHNSIATRPRKDTRKGLLRSRVTNGRSHFVETDQRGAWARRWRDIHNQIISDISSGGPESLSEGQRQLVRRATTLSIQCELLEGKIAKGDEIDNESFDIYGKLTDRIGRCFQRLGLKRQSKEINQTLDQYLRSKRIEAAE